MALRQIKRMVRKVQRYYGLGRYDAAKRTARRKYVYGIHRRERARKVFKARSKLRKNDGPQGTAYWQQELAAQKRRTARVQQRERQAITVARRIHRQHTTRRGVATQTSFTRKVAKAKTRYFSGGKR